MKKAFLCFTVDDVGVEGYSTEHHLEKILEFCLENRISSTLFAVPFSGGRKLARAGGYRTLLREASSLGHEIAQHGLRHDRFEVGIPPGMILEMKHEAPAREYFAKHRPEISRDLTVDRIRSRLKEGRDIIQEASGREVKGFRAPCLQTCENLFNALFLEKYLYDSSLYLQKSGWDIMAGRENAAAEEMTREKFASMQDGRKINIFPLTTDYTWYLSRDRFDAALSLAKHDFDSCADEGIPFVPFCHVSPVQEGSEGAGFELYRKLFEHARIKCAREGFELHSVTLSGLVEEYNS